jgi:hypothetical protein
VIKMQCDPPPLARPPPHLMPLRRYLNNIEAALERRLHESE